MTEPNDNPKLLVDAAAGKPPWIGDYGPQLSRKTYGRIFVHTPEDADRVLEIAKSIDESEVDGYMPDDFIAVWPEDGRPRLVYGHKFELRTDLLEYRCFVEKIPILIVTGHREYP